MKTILQSIILSTLFITFTFANIINVPADIDSIQGGIDMAVDGDTVLVQVGTYYENINFNGKNIVVGSLTLTTGDTSFISQTIISSADTSPIGFRGSVVTFENGEDSTAILTGFTITNGFQPFGGGISCDNSHPTLSYLVISNNIASNGGGIYCSNNSNPQLSNLLITENQSTQGGGIFCDNSDLTITDVKIKNNITPQHPQGGSEGGGIFCRNSNLILINVLIQGNKSSDGGGIYCESSNLSLSNTDIKNNSTISIEGRGGGIYLKNSTVNFDAVNRCNIFLNSALMGCDIASSGTSSHTVLVDTFTVSNPNSFFAYPISNFIIDKLNNKIIQVNSDLYVNPTGNDSNSGLLPSDPLKTISCAIIKILADSLNPRNIYLANGLYSPTTNGENYPFFLRSYISLIGESERGVILGEKISVERTIQICQAKKVLIENLTITGGRGIVCTERSEAILLHLTLNNMQGDAIMCKNHSLTTLSYVSILNTDGVGIASENYTFNSHANINIYNSTISGNHTNCSFHSEHSKVNIINSIFWNPIVNDIISWGDVEINVVHSDVGSAWAVNGNVNLIAGNINSDPMFVDTANGDYRLQQGSPCIDAGIAFFELGGDTLINLNSGQYIGSAPDMGAYEFDPTSSLKEKLITPVKYSLDQNYPNPFNPSTTIEFTLPKSEFTTLKVYNILGKEVSTLVSNKLNPGNHTYTFNGKNLASGIYYYQLTAGDFREVKKMILIK